MTGPEVDIDAELDLSTAAQHVKEAAIREEREDPIESQPPAENETESHFADAHTAAEKITHTLRELSRPDPDAGGLELSLASVAMGLETGLAEQLGEKQETGELDEFVLALTRFLALHRSDSARALFVVEMPRRKMPNGMRLKLLDDAIEAAETASSPL